MLLFTLIWIHIWGFLFFLLKPGGAMQSHTVVQLHFVSGSSALCSFVLSQKWSVFLADKSRALSQVAAITHLLQPECKSVILGGIHGFKKSTRSITIQYYCTYNGFNQMRQLKSSDIQGNCALHF